jgi:RimJ/RimL family protein N-acetyltransferase
MARVYLRALESADLERCHKWHNDPALYRSLIGPFRYVSPTVEADWLNEAQRISQRQINLAICLEETSEHIGNIYLREIDWIARHAELHVLIGQPKWRGQGFGREAAGLLLKHAFDDLGLHRVYLFVLADNLSAINMYAACGFVQEGLLRDHAFKNGSFRDVIVMGKCHETGS